MSLDTNIPTPRTDADLILDIEGNWDTKALRLHAYAKQLERELAQAKAENEKLYNSEHPQVAELRMLKQECARMDRRLREAKADLAAARKDSERLDWIEANIDTATFDTWSNVNGEGIIVEKFKRGGGMVGYMEENLRATIDAAMEGGER